MIGKNAATRNATVNLPGGGTATHTLMTITPPALSGLDKKEWHIDTNNVTVFINGTKVKSPGVNYGLADINTNADVILSGFPATEVYARQ